MNYLADTRRWRQRGSTRQEGSSSEEAPDMKWIFSFQVALLNFSGALNSSCVSSLAALVPHSVTTWPGVWSPGVHREERLGSLLFQTCAFERRQVSTNGPQKGCPLPCHYHFPSLHYSLLLTGMSLPHLVYGKYLWRSHSGGVWMLLQISPKLPNPAQQSYRSSSSFEPFIPGSETIHRFMPLELVCYVNTSHKYYVFSLGIMMWKHWETLASFTLYN